MACYRLIPIAIALIGCGPSPTRTQPATATTPAQEASPSLPVATAPAAPQVEPAPTRSKLADECRGTELDLGVLAGKGTCRTEERASPMPPMVTVSLSPATFEIKSRGTAKAELVLANTGDKEQLLVIDNWCNRLANKVDYRIDDAKGKRIDLRVSECGNPGSCLPRSLAIELAPAGTARIAFDVIARSEELDATCMSERILGLPRGKYTLKVAGPYGIVTAPIQIK